MEYKWVESFLDYYSSLNKAENTIKNYRIDLEQFHKFLLKQYNVKSIDNNLYNKISKGDLIDFSSYLTKLNLSPSSRSRKLSAVKAFLFYLYDLREVIKKDLSNSIKMPKIGKRIPIYLTEEESIKLINVIKSENGRYVERDICMILMFLTNGLRVSELCNIEEYKIKENKMTIIGKGNKQRELYLTPSVLESLNDYLTWKSKRKLQDTTHLFISRSGKQLTPEAVQLLVKKYKRLAGITENITPHKLRHTAATLMLEGGDDLRTIQENLGHATISTTEIYVHINDKKKEQSANRNPLANIL